VSLAQWLLFLVAGFLIVYAAAVFALVVAGRRTDARALALFVPDCIVLLSAWWRIHTCLGRERHCWL
jgi:hypothetical protein